MSAPIDLRLARLTWWHSKAPLWIRPSAILVVTAHGHDGECGTDIHTTSGMFTVSESPEQVFAALMEVP